MRSCEAASSRRNVGGGRNGSRSPAVLGPSRPPGRRRTGNAASLVSSVHLAGLIEIKLTFRRGSFGARLRCSLRRLVKRRVHLVRSKPVDTRSYARGDSAGGPRPAGNRREAGGYYYGRFRGDRGAARRGPSQRRDDKRLALGTMFPEGCGSLVNTSPRGDDFQRRTATLERPRLVSGQRRREAPTHVSSFIARAARRRRRRDGEDRRSVATVHAAWSSCHHRGRRRCFRGGASRMERSGSSDPSRHKRRSRASALAEKAPSARAKTLVRRRARRRWGTTVQRRSQSDCADSCGVA